MKRFTVPCDFNGVKHPFHVYIGEPHPKKHPLQFQAWWLSSERGGTIPQDVMDSFEKLFKISQENNVSFEDLCVYALGTASEENANADSGSKAGANGAPAGGSAATPPANPAASNGSSGGGAATPPANPAAASGTNGNAPAEPPANPAADNPIPPPRTDT